MGPVIKLVKVVAKEEKALEIGFSVENAKDAWRMMIVANAGKSGRIFLIFVQYFDLVPKSRKDFPRIFTICLTSQVVLTKKVE